MTGNRCTKLSETEEALVLENVKIAYWMARKMMLEGWFDENELEDMEQEAIIGLMTAARKYDPERGTQFSTLATWAVQNKLRTAITKKKREKRKAQEEALSLDDKRYRETQGDDAENLSFFVPAEDDVEMEVLSIKVQDVMGMVRRRMRNVFPGEWLALKSQGMTIAEIAQRYGVSKQYVSLEIQKAKKVAGEEIRRMGLV